MLLFRGVLLVAYAAADEIVIARGTDLQALRRLRLPAEYVRDGVDPTDCFVSAVAFRSRDAAIVAAFGDIVVVFTGWCEEAKERGLVYDTSLNEVILDGREQGLCQDIVSLSWDGEGKMLCAVADCVVVWTLSSEHMPVKYRAHILIPASSIPTHPLAMGAISPDGSFLAVSGLYARLAYVFALPRKETTTEIPCAEIVHGRSGIASLDWKKRGGGNQALMTVDRDGTMHLWVRASTTHQMSIPHQGLATGSQSWMVEIARSPHVERTPRAGAAFLVWGGGGGVADDEGDALATNAAHPLLAEGTAPKPSRCYHWIVRVGGGGASAWRVRGLDDRPRAEYARVEPGSGDAVHGWEEDIDDELRPPDLPLLDVAVASMRAVSPIPVTTASQYKIGLVKSYAVSNGERRLRSPEPPDPPNVVAIFVLAVRNGIPFLARYDICPTSNMPAVCRARVGAGHTSSVVELVRGDESTSTASGNCGWLASRGEGGDVLLWRTNVSTGAWEAMTAVAALPGPHTAVSFAPARMSSPNRSDIGVFTSDSALGSLRLFQFVNFVKEGDTVSAQGVQFARQVAVCHARNRGTFDSVSQLISLPLGDGNSDPFTKSTCAVFGVRNSGRLSVWRAARRRRDTVSLEPCVIRVLGGRHEVVTFIASNELTTAARQIFATGGADGSMYVYIVGESESETNISTYVAGDSEEEDGDEGVIWLRELCRLKDLTQSHSAVEKIEILYGGSRILAVYASGRTIVWSRTSSDAIVWNIELSCGTVTSPDSNCLSAGSVGSIGFDHDGNFSVVLLRKDGSFERHKRSLGMPWEFLQRSEFPQQALPAQSHTLTHIGKSVVVASNGRGMSVLAVSKPDSHPLSFISDAAGYNPSKALMAHVLTGGRSWQIVAALQELHTFIRKVAQRKASETSYGAGRGVIPPPPSLSMLTSERENAPNENEDETNLGVIKNNLTTNIFQVGPVRSLFAELMAKSESKLANGESHHEDDDEDSEDASAASEDLLNLANRLKVFSLAGVTRSEQSVLSAIARACFWLRTTLHSLDVPGARFALLAACHQELSKSDPVPLPVVACAVHSSSSDALLDQFLPNPSPGKRNSKERTRMWDTAEALGAGWWIGSVTGCKELAERIARADFNSRRDADDAALWYIALGRRRALSALYRAQQNSPMSQFLLRDFSKDENRLAAGKNAYVLVSKHRLELAVGFFILASDVQGALNLVRTRIKDDQLAILLSRILNDGEYLSRTLDNIIRSCDERGDDHRKSLALWVSGRHKEALIEASKARYPSSGVRISDADRALAGSLPEVVHSLTHVLAIANRPPIRGTSLAKDLVRECRRKAVRALLGDGSPVAALVISFEMMRSDSEPAGPQCGRTFSKRLMETSQGSVLLAAVETMKGRAVCLAGAVRSGASDKNLQRLLVRDLSDLRNSPLGLDRLIKAIEYSVFELVKEDEIDAAVAATYAAAEILDMEEEDCRKMKKRINASQRNCLRVAVSRALFHVQGALSLLHHPTFSSQRLSELLGKYKIAMCLIEKKMEGYTNSLLCRLVTEFRGSILSLKFALAFLRGDWPGIWYSLRACEVSWNSKCFIMSEDMHERDADDSHSMASGCSSLAPDSVSVEALRHVASNPAILSISRNLGHIRRYRKAPSISMVGDSAGSATTVVDDSLGTPTLSVKSDDPYAVIRIHPVLSSTLAAVALAYLTAHIAAHAASFAKCIADESKCKTRDSQMFWHTEYGEGFDQSFRLIKASETVEHLAEDAISQWAPLQRFGTEATTSSMSLPDESAGAFVDLWSTLGCLPEYAPSLSEAATVAAAEMAAAASKAAIEAAEQKDGGRRRRRRRERKGEKIASVAKEGLKLFDTTSADSLYGAYPVRFSAAATGPWSGRGGHASLYSEERALFRTLCISATDPPAVVVATPKGVQEIVPSSYTTMPAGFRSHYSGKKRGRCNQDDVRLEALANDRRQESLENSRDEEDSFLSSYDGFGEGPYVPLDMAPKDGTRNRMSRSHGERKAVWRHQVQATTLASHPLRRRFASGGTDGVVRLWDFGDPISLASFREDHFGRISDLCFSAYGNTMMAVYSSGHVTIWDEPDVYSSYPRKGGKKGSRAKIIRAFDNRAASGGTFLDERHTIAVVGDSTAPPSVGHSLRIFDTREPHSAFHASWSTAVNHQFEARCLTLLEDRMRLVTGGLDGSLSIVDIRTKACIAELPAHADEVTCLALEVPRGRALVSGSSSGEIKLWDSRTLLQLDVIQEAHTPTRHYWSGNGIGGLVGSYGTQGLALTDRSLISCGGDGVVKIWGPGWSDFDLNVL